jgi:hypothetical protein
MFFILVKILLIAAVGGAFDLAIWMTLFRGSKIGILNLCDTDLG